MARMSWKRQQEWATTFQCVWQRVRSKLIHVELPAEQDWEDLRSAAMIRVFQKQRLFDSSKAGLYTWMLTVVYRATQNGLRPWLTTSDLGRERSRVWRAKPLRTWEFEGYGDNGRPLLVPADDVAAAPLRTERVVDGFAKALDKRQRQVLKLVQQGRTARQIERRLGMSQNQVYPVIYRIRERYLRWSKTLAQ